MLKNFALSFVVFAILTSVTMAQTSEWADVAIGQTVHGIKYDELGVVTVNNKFVMSCVPDQESAYGIQLSISQLSKLKKFVLIRCSKDEQDEGYIIDTIRNQVVSRDIVPKHWKIANWISWSPDEKFALVAASGEVTNGDMAFIDLQKNKIEEIHFKALTNNPRIKEDIMEEIQYFDPDGVSWLNNNIFTLKMEVHCNPYESGDENCFSKILRSQKIQVTLVPFLVKYLPNSTKAVQAQKSTTQNSKISEIRTKLLKQLLQDDESARDCLRESYGGNELKLFQKFKVKPVDLNSDGQPEYIVEANDDSGSGIGQDQCFGDWRGNNNIWIYGKTESGYNQFLQGVFSVSIAPLKNLTNGYRNLKDAGHNGVFLIETIYKFDGNRYKAAECLTYEFIETRKGGTTTKLVERDDCSGYPGIKDN